MKGDFNLSTGDVIKIVIGQMGTRETYTSSLGNACV
jgi:hypothetical protein